MGPSRCMCRGRRRAASYRRGVLGIVLDIFRIVGDLFDDFAEAHPLTLAVGEVLYHNPLIYPQKTEDAGGLKRFPIVERIVEQDATSGARLKASTLEQDSHFR